MISLTIAKKYARALLDIGLREGNYETLGKELEKISDLLAANKELRNVLLSSIFPAATRKAIARTISEPLGLSKSMVGFIDLLIERERIDHFPEIVSSFESLCDDVSRRLRATLVTAMELSPESVQAIKEQLEFFTGKQVILSVEKEPSLIGGLITKIGNIIYDGSLKSQLLQAKENLCKE